jgi:hypothetical protein
VRNALKIVYGKLEKKKLLAGFRRRRDDNSKVNHEKLYMAVRG